MEKLVSLGTPLEMLVSFQELMYIGCHALVLPAAFIQQKCTTHEQRSDATLH